MEDRPIEVQLNIACDTAAKECMRRCIKPTKRSQPLEGAGATLYFGNSMVTTNMKEQIQYAAQVPQMKKYVQSRLKCKDGIVDDINWTAIGRAKGRLIRHQSIRTSKMMYGWLNIGVQKKYMGQDDTCPCCGNAKETQIHLYRCKNKKMRETLRASIASAKSKMVTDRIPSNIYNVFVGEICKMAQIEHPDAKYVPDDIDMEETLLLQRKISKEAILRGFLHNDWTRKLNNNWKPLPPRPDGKKVHQKDPMEQTTALIQAVWTIFENQWSQRNDLLHGSENELLPRYRQERYKKYFEYRREKYSKLRRCDHHMVEHPMGDVIKWSRQKCRKILLDLDELHKLYLKELKLENERLQPITAFFRPVSAASPPCQGDPG